MSEQPLSPREKAQKPASTRPRLGRRALAIASILLLAVGLAACGGGNGSETSGGGGGEADLGYVEKQVDEHLGVPGFEAPGPPFDASKVAGKSIFEIPLSSTIPFIAAKSKEMKKVAERFGIDYTTWENEGTPPEWVRGMDQAIARKVDLIILQGAPDPDLLQPQLKRAEQAGIPVLATFIIDEHESVPAGLTATVRTPATRRLRLVADYVIAQTKGDANVLVVTSNDIRISRAIGPAIEDEFEKRCPSCSVTVADVPLADWATKIQTTVQSQITSNPDLDYVIPIFDGMAQYAVAGVLQAGASDRVSVATSDATPSVLADLQRGRVVKLEAGTNPAWIAWANMDQAMRMLSGAGPIESGNEKLPIRLIDESNVAETGEPPQLGQGFGNAYIKGYDELWEGGK
jgi:ribose transport system substrate-binding protein